MPFDSISAAYPDIIPEATILPKAAEAIRLLASGGDARIVLDKSTGLNRYFSAPYPRRTLAFASSTANDLSADAFSHVCHRLSDGLLPYGVGLDSLRDRIRAAYEIEDAYPIAFAASGTDLEYLAITAVSGLCDDGVHNVLLGADEVGSGCSHSAHGRFFADQTPLGLTTRPGTTVAGMEQVSLADVPVRCSEGRARTAADVVESIEVEIELARCMNRHALIHGVHGSKTGLILPELTHIDYLQRKWGREHVTFVIDACQARITSEALAAYLDLGAIVLVTGSKFMGGAPFNGFAIFPPRLMKTAAAPCAGLARIFNRPEFPASWPGRERLPDGTNRGLQLRLDAAIFELERFQNLGLTKIERVIAGFEEAVEHELLQKRDVALVPPYAPGRSDEAQSHPIEMRTLKTFDVSQLPGLRTFADAQSLHAKLAREGLRLGQPVKCVRLPEGGWGGTLRVGLSMPQIVQFSALNDEALRNTLRHKMGLVGQALLGEKVA